MLLFVCVMAAMLPTDIVRTETTVRITTQCSRSGAIAIRKMRIIIANDAAFTATDMYAVIDVGAPS